MAIEDILCEIGGFGRFQLFVLLGVGMNRLTIGWSMLQMSYAGNIPEWFCLGPNTNNSQSGSAHACFINNSSRAQNSDVEGCDKFHFVGSAVTVVSEWNLVCSLSWVKSVVTSLQMAGVLLGALVAGQMGDSLGRKKTLYIFVLEHSVLNFAAAFSVNWQMFAICRFFVGLGIGGVLVSSFPYPLEFLPLKWRPLVSVLPIWSVGICLFALASWLMENWSYLHIACGALSLTGLLGYIYVPESIRWLTVHDRMSEAHDVVMKIALSNRVLQPRKASITLQAVAWEEQKTHDIDKLYTYIDIFRESSATKTTLIFCFHWFSLSLVYYGISFSVSHFAGVVYLNIFLLAVVEIPAIVSTFYLDNKIGRKWTTMISLAVSCVPLLACMVVEIVGPESYKTTIITVLCILAKVGLGAAWAVAETWCSEFYPTVTRCLGLGTLYTAASIGALITPFLINLNDMAVVSFAVMGCLLLVDMILCIFTPETKDLEIADTPTSAIIARELEEDQNASATDSEAFEKGEDNIESDGKFSEEFARNMENIILEIVEEDESDNEMNEKVAEDTITVTENSKKELSPQTSNNSPNIKRDKTHKTELRITESQIDKGLSTPSPGASPAASPRTRRLDKIKTETENGQSTPSPRDSPTASPRTRRLDKIKSGEFFHGKSKPKPKDEFPPYIESSHNKNVRFSIY